MKKEYIFKGESYSSYYQLEKVMKIPRKTIQYRHEVIGLPLDEVPEYQPKPPIERLGDKRFYPVPKREKSNDEEHKKIIEYPKAPSLYLEQKDTEEERETKKNEYRAWLIHAPDTLIRRELSINEKDLTALIEEEKKTYFYGSFMYEEMHEEMKDSAEETIKIIRSVLEEKE